MALRLAGEAVGTQEVLESILYAPSLQTSGDVEPGTRTVTATTKPATPDYASSLTVPAPSSSMLTVKRLGLRLQVTIDSFGGTPPAALLNYAVHVNGIQRLSGSWNATGAQYGVVDLTSGQFNLGSANSLEVFLWVNQGNAVVSLCQLWLAVGTTSTSIVGLECVSLTYQGLMSCLVQINRVGTGTTTAFYRLSDITVPGWSVSSGNIQVDATLVVNPQFWCYGSVATDLNYFASFQLLLRRVE